MDILVSNQQELFAGSKIAKNKLVLLPMGVLTRVPADKVAKNQTTISATGLKHDVYVIHPWKADFQKKTGMFCPYWYVKEGEEGCLEKKTMKIGALTVPYFTNKKQVERGTPLWLEIEEVAEGAEASASSKRRRVTK